MVFSNQVKGHRFVFINPPRLADFKQVLNKAGLQVYTCLSNVCVCVCVKLVLTQTAPHVCVCVCVCVCVVCELKVVAKVVCVRGNGEREREGESYYSCSLTMK